VPRGKPGQSAPTDDVDEQTNEPERFDVGQLGELLKARRGQLSIRQAAQEAGISFSTLSRVEAGAQPDLATFMQLCAWLAVSPSRFFTPVVERQVDPLDAAITHLHGDPRLTSEAATKIGGVLRDMYEALAKEVSPSSFVVACHLRATSVMRPGVSARLAEVLTDMQGELWRRHEAGTL
jgi:transcriptional regulator with XRE-family HTH domain